MEEKTRKVGNTDGRSVLFCGGPGPVTFIKGTYHTNEEFLLTRGRETSTEYTTQLQTMDLPNPARKTYQRRVREVGTRDKPSLLGFLNHNRLDRGLQELKGKEVEIWEL